MKFGITAIAIIVVAMVAGCAGRSITTEELGKTRETSVGRILVDSRDMTLYTYDKDEPGKSNCTALCAVFWPPAKAATGARPSGKFTLVTRDDGSQQWAYDGMPLYGYIHDEEPDDVSGNGVDGVWHVVHP